MKTLKGLLTGIAIGLASLLPMKANAQSIDGWLEASKGIPTNNLRLYPKLSAFGVNVKSLIDINGFYQFSKTNASYDGLKTKIDSVEINPVATLFQDEFKGTRGMAGVNVSYSIPEAFGFAEVGINPTNAKKDSKFYTYNGLILPDSLGSIGLFTASSINDFWKMGFGSTYAEVEATGPRIYNGVSPYVRGSFAKGQAPGWQAGISINPKELIEGGEK